MSLTPSNIIQYSEYYPFLPIAIGMQTANSWTRENATGNNFLANGGTELNTTSGVYDLEYRNYDPALGRMNQIDPMASKYASMTPYNYAFNDPVYWNDASGAEPNYYREEAMQRRAATINVEDFGRNIFAWLYRGGNMNSMFNTGWSVGSGSLSYASAGGMSGASQISDFVGRVNAAAANAKSDDEEIYGYSGKAGAYGFWLRANIVGVAGIGTMGGANLMSDLFVIEKFVEYKLLARAAGVAGLSLYTGWTIGDAIGTNIDRVSSSVAGLLIKLGAPAEN